MTAFGSDEHLITALAVIVAALLLDQWLLRTGRIERRHHRVPHYKLRASRSRRDAHASRPAPQRPNVTPGAGSSTPAVAGTAATRGSAGNSVETRPAPGRHETPPGAGTELQAGDSCLDRDSVVPTASGESQPAPVPPLDGAGPEPRTAVPSPPLCGSGGPGLSSRPGSAPPDLALVGPELHNLVDLGASLEITGSAT